MHKQYPKQTTATDYAAHRANISQQVNTYQSRFSRLEFVVKIETAKTIKQA
ncbi:MAG: hypothetical protein AABY01_02905 [Nanoarchaeota archaeon]